MQDTVVIGIDAGTTAVKAVAFSLTSEIVQAAHRQVPVDYGRGGEAEQDMIAIWEAVVECLSEVTTALDGREVLGVGVTGQGDGAWLLDDSGTPLRKAALWLDGRAGERVNAWQADGRGQLVLDTTGTVVFPGLAPVLLEEFEQDSPGFLDSIGTVFYCKDWVRYQLTGELATDYTEASRNFLNVSSGEGYDREFAEKLGLGAILDALPQVLKSDAVGGRVSAEAAQRTGLKEGTPVAVGMIDVAVTGPGLGAIDDEDSWLILGTTGFIGTLRGSVQERRSDASMVLATGRGRQVLEFLAPMTGAPNLDWIRDTLAFADWPEAEKAARTVGPGSAGVIYLPYASPGGERAPFQDSAASASWLGLSISTTPAQILRSVYEGVSFSLVECCQALDLTDDLVVSGGGFRSDLVCEILADTMGRRVVRQSAPEAGARGAATLALVAAGGSPDLKQAAEAMVTSTTSFEPNVQNHDLYRQAFEVYKASRDAIRPVWPAMRKLRIASINDTEEN